MTSASQESLAEAKAKRDFCAFAVADEVDALLEKFSYNNQCDCVDNAIRRKHPFREDKEAGAPLTTGETNKAELSKGEESTGMSYW